jgi:hypothetical protein
MTEKVETMERALDLAEKFTSKLEALAVKHSPEVWDLALTAARIDAATNLVYGFFGAAACGVAIYAAGEFYKKTNENVTEDNIMGFFISCVVGVGSGIAVVAYWADLWVWAGVIEPKLWLAKQVLGF